MHAIVMTVLALSRIAPAINSYAGSERRCILALYARRRIEASGIRTLLFSMVCTIRLGAVVLFFPLDIEEEEEEEVVGGTVDVVFVFFFVTLFQLFIFSTITILLTIVSCLRLHLAPLSLVGNTLCCKVAHNDARLFAPLPLMQHTFYTNKGHCSHCCILRMIHAQLNGVPIKQRNNNTHNK